VSWLEFVLLCVIGIVVGMIWSYTEDSEHG